MNRTSRKNRTLKRTLSKMRQKGGWGMFRWFTKKSKPRRWSFFSKKKDIVSTHEIPNHEHRTEKKEENFQKEKKNSNDELRGIFGIEKRNNHNQPIKSMNSSMKSMKSSK